VFAITITLLVIDIGRPSPESGDLLQALIHQWPSYVAFIVSFIYVGVVWMNHHALFTHIRSVDRNLQWINLGMLMMTALLPFPTAVLAEALAQRHPDNERVAVALYALVSGLMSAAWIPMFRYLRRHPHLLASPDDLEYFTPQGIRPLTGVALYTLAGVVGFLSPLVGLALFVVMVTFYAFTSEGVRGQTRSTRPV
jgi:uncharacterized membrane protein